MLVRARSHDVDALAENLIAWGQLARAMPPSWDADAHKIPVRGPGGERAGHLLPGRGYYCDLDLRALGITQPLPCVYERTPTRRLLEALEDPRRVGRVAAALLAALTGGGAAPVAVIAGYNDVINARANGKAFDRTFVKNSLTTVATNWSSLYQAGGTPAAGTYTNIPTGAVLTNASTGALSAALPNTTGSDLSYLLTFGFTAAQQIQMALLVDLLVGAGNITCNVTTAAQTVNTTALTRHTDAKGVWPIFEVTTALGATPANVTVNSYTNSAGTTTRTTAAIAMTASAIASRLQPVAVAPMMVLQSGDVGVKSVEQVTISALMGAGVIALNLYYPMMFVPGIAANIYLERDSTTQIDGLSQIAEDGSKVMGCLALYVLTNTTSSGVLTGFVRTAQG